jgi:16S rRNA (cytosine1402-N4)-methyltransferase
MPPPASASRHDSGVNDWTCGAGTGRNDGGGCGSVNFARRNSCFRCSAARPGGVAAATPGNIQGALTNITAGGAGAGAGAGAGGAAGQHPTQGTAADGFEVFVKYLPHTADENEIAEFFTQFGTLHGEVRLLRNPVTGQAKGAGFVSFAAEHARALALAKARGSLRTSTRPTFNRVLRK